MTASFFLLLCLTAVGCGRFAGSTPVVQPKAREACVTFMTAWKEGKKIEDLKPQIIGRDSDWDSGLKLESFELLPNDYSDGPNLHITVRRTVKDDKGRISKQDVPYTVTTSSTILVFRSDD